MEEKFEPIYYDGEIQLGQLVTSYDADLTINLVKFAVPDGISSQFLNKVKHIDKEALLAAFMDRVKHGNEKDKNSLLASFNRLHSNWRANIETLSKPSLVDTNSSIKSLRLDKSSIVYAQKTKQFGVEQKVINSIKIGDASYEVTFTNGEQISMEPSEVVEVLSRNTFRGQRTVFLPDEKISLNPTRNLAVNLDGFKGSFVSTIGLAPDFDEKLKIVTFTQSNPKDWVLVKDAKIDGWSIKLLGVPFDKSGFDSNAQRFNEFGLTGCLNFINSHINNSDIYTFDGGCEDSVNLISSFGERLL